MIVSANFEIPNEISFDSYVNYLREIGRRYGFNTKGKKDYEVLSFDEHHKLTILWLKRQRDMGVKDTIVSIDSVISMMEMCVWGGGSIGHIPLSAMNQLNDFFTRMLGGTSFYETNMNNLQDEMRQQDWEH